MKTVTLRVTKSYTVERTIDVSDRVCAELEAIFEGGDEPGDYPRVAELLDDFEESDATECECVITDFSIENADGLDEVYDLYD